MKSVMSRRAYPLILGVLCLAAASAWAADPKRNLAVASSKPAAANEARVALVIGNSHYKSAPLKNPVNDAKAIAEKLQGLGFKVTLKLDQNQRSMAEAIRVFGNQLKAGGAGLFYYAGHGMQVRGRNFLIPVDADIQNEDEVPYRSVDANEVLSKMETAKNRLNLMILDACRNNPFARKFRSSSQGLAQMDAPSGTLVAFATAPGSVASDGTGKNGIYTQHLLASLGQPGVPVEQLFKRVRVGVMKDTRNAQVPWESSSLVGDFYFKPGTTVPTSADPAAIELAYWESIKDSTSADDYKAYLKKYPNGQFADLAKRRALNPPKPTMIDISIEPTQNYEKGKYFLARSEYSNAFPWIRKAAEQGLAVSQNNLGVMYEKGQGVAKNEAEAVKWYRKAAEQGFSVAQQNIGVMYANGRGISKDDAEAVRWYRKAAEQGHAIAQLNLGVMYANGRGISKDDTEAVQWYRKAAEQGDAKGQNNLGFMYEHGRGVSKDESEAVRWFRKAAEQGDADAQTAARQGERSAGA